MLDIFLTQSAVEKKNEKIAQNHIAVFSTRNRRFYHIFGTRDLFNISYSRELYLFSKFLHFEEIVRV